MKTIWI